MHLMSALGHKRTFAVRPWQPGPAWEEPSAAHAALITGLARSGRSCAMSAAAMSRWPADQARKRCISRVRKPQLEKVGKRVAHHAATLIVPRDYPPSVVNEDTRSRGAYRTCSLRISSNPGVDAVAIASVSVSHFFPSEMNCSKDFTPRLRLWSTVRWGALNIEFSSQ